MIAHLIFTGEPSFPHESNHTSVVYDIEDRSADAVSVVALRSFDVGVSNPSGGAHGKAFSGVKQLAGSSPGLLQALDQAMNYEQIELELRGPDPDGGTERVQARYIFTGVTMGGIGWSNTAAAQVGTDRIAFSYRGLHLIVDTVEAEVSL